MCNPVCACACRSVLSQYGEVYFRAWRVASGPYLEVGMFLLSMQFDKFVKKLKTATFTATAAWERVAIFSDQSGKG